jgi:hypothetical protein
MSPAQLFSIANGIAALAWLLLVVLPGRRWVTEIVTGKVVPAIFALLYIGIVVTTFGRAEGSFSTLSGVSTLFDNPWLLLAGWLHYLAFDLLIGTWEAQDARAHGVPHLVLIPCLILTFMFGPTGWLAYMAARLISARVRAVGNSMTAHAR